jgi:hypothetical protein
MFVQVREVLLADVYRWIPRFSFVYCSYLYLVSKYLLSGIGPLFYRLLSLQVPSVHEREEGSSGCSFSMDVCVPEYRFERRLRKSCSRFSTSLWNIHAALFELAVCENCLLFEEGREVFEFSKLWQHNGR